MVRLRPKAVHARAVRRTRLNVVTFIDMFVLSSFQNLPIEPQKRSLQHQVSILGPSGIPRRQLWARCSSSELCCKSHALILNSVLIRSLGTRGQNQSKGNPRHRRPNQIIETRIDLLQSVRNKNEIHEKAQHVENVLE